MIKSEVGGEFWDVPTCGGKNSLFPDKTKWFLSGRVQTEPT